MKFPNKCYKKTQIFKELVIIQAIAFIMQSKLSCREKTLIFDGYTRSEVTCEPCNVPLQVQKTRLGKRAATLAIGEFAVHETVLPDFPYLCS